MASGMVGGFFTGVDIYPAEASVVITTGLSGTTSGRTEVSGFLGSPPRALSGSIAGATTVTATMRVSATFHTFTIAGSTTVAGSLTRSILSGISAGHASVTGYLNLAVLGLVGRTAAGRTTVTGRVISVYGLTAVSHGRTTVVARARAGFGADISLWTIVHAVPTLTIQLSGGTAHGRTTVTALAPINGFAGRAWGGTRFTTGGYGMPDALVGTYIGTSRTYDFSVYYQGHFNPPTLFMGIIFGGHPAGRTTFMSLIQRDRSGRNPPFYGPSGSVSLNWVPKGDLGLPSIIAGSTVVNGKVLAFHQRQLILFGATGLETFGQLRWTGDAARGPGQRIVTGTTAKETAAARGPQKQAVYYV